MYSRERVLGCGLGHLVDLRGGVRGGLDSLVNLVGRIGGVC